MNKNTVAGPWQVARESQRFFVKDAKDGQAITGWGNVTQLEEQARLIAAAPDLLAACEKALVEMTVAMRILELAGEDSGEWFTETVAALKTATAKAKGSR